MDTPLDKAIRAARKRLEQLISKDPDAVFHCPVCGKYFENLLNYTDLKMCAGCYVKTKTAELQKHVEQLNGATIVDIQIEPADPMCPETNTPAIVEITVRTADGKTLKLKKPPEVTYIL